ncbi:hypothetical protein UZ38_41070, partial [Bacillus amyloliquefaciens]
NHRDMVEGLKSDVYLRSIGSRYSSMKDFSRMLDATRKYHFKSLAKQLFMLFEDIRIEEFIKRERPGTKPVFSSRKSMYRKHFATQLTLNLERSIFTDALFCA